MGGQWRKENPNPWVHRSGGKLGEPRFPHFSETHYNEVELYFKLWIEEVKGLTN